MNKKGLTLTELIAATIVTGIVMIGVASMDISIRNAFEGTSKGSIVASRAAALMQHISRHILEASGNVTNPGINVDTAGEKLWIRKDNLTPSNYADDTWYLYKRNGASSTIDYCTTASSNTSDCTSTPQTFQNITAFTPVLINNPAAYQFAVGVTLTSRYNVASAGDDLKNPEYTVSSVFNLPSSSSTIP